MGPESHSAMLPKEMAGSAARMTQKWQRKLVAEGWGGGGEGLGLAGWQESCCSVWQVKTIYFFPSHEI